jgi:ribose transport system permease protein
MNKTINRVDYLGFKKFTSKPEFSSLIILGVMFVITAVLQKNFFEAKSIIRNINAFTPLILMTMGQALVIISGGIDLSAGASLSLLTCVLTFVMERNSPVTGIYAILITFIVAVLIGVINGIGMGYLRIPPVIVTFATSFMWLGAALFLRPTPGGECVGWFKIFYNVSSIEGISGFIKAFGTVIPPALILVLVSCILWFIISKTKTGRHIYAVGSNEDSAYASGINTAKVQMTACIINSVFIFLTALFFVGQNQSGDARMGDPLTLKAIAAAVVGGVALTGGRGSVYFAIVGALILSLVSKIIFFANIPNAYQTLVSGVIVIAAIAGSLAYTLYNKRAKLKESK